MRKEALEQVKEDLLVELAKETSKNFAIIGHTPAAYEIRSMFIAFGALTRLTGTYSDSQTSGDIKPMSELRSADVDVAIVASDADKERLLRAAAPHLQPRTRVIIACYEHLKFRDDTFDEVVRNALVPSLANGYPDSLPHIFQCLQSASRLGLKGVVAEFGVFKGGTTMMLARFIERLGQIPQHVAELLHHAARVSLAYPRYEARSLCFFFASLNRVPVSPASPSSTKLIA